MCDEQAAEFQWIPKRMQVVAMEVEWLIDDGRGCVCCSASMANTRTA
jgi:hypothetical protein